VVELFGDVDVIESNEVAANDSSDQERLRLSIIMVDGGMVIWIGGKISKTWRKTMVLLNCERKSGVTVQRYLRYFYWNVPLPSPTKSIPIST
jgi:hypothetical protein